jgi:hypothetical protein
VWSYPCCPPRAARFEADLPGEKTNIDRGKECDCQGRTHNQNNRRRSIKKPARASTAVSTICPASFSITASGLPLYHNRWAHNTFRHAKVKSGQLVERTAPAAVEHSFLSGGDRRRQRQQMPVDMDNWRDVVIDTLNEMACASALRRFFLSS